MNIQTISSLLLTASASLSLLAGCGGKPSEKEVFAAFERQHNTRHAEMWCVAQIKSIEYGKPFKNRGAIEREPNNATLVPVTVLWNQMSRKWRFTDVAFLEMRDEYIFTEADKGWAWYSLNSKSVGNALSGVTAESAIDNTLALLEKTKAGDLKPRMTASGGDIAGFENAHLNVIEGIRTLNSNAGKGDLSAHTSILNSYLDKVSLQTNLDAIVRIKLKAEILAAFQIEASQTAGRVGHHVMLGVEATPEEKQELSACQEFLLSPEAAGVTEAWKYVKN